MTIARGFKYRIHPTAGQIVYFNNIFGATRYVYNRALAENSVDYEQWKTYPEFNKKPDVSQLSLGRLTTVFRNDPDSLWLNEVPYTAIKNSLRDLSKAFNLFFKQIKANKNAGYPRFKRKEDKQSFRIDGDKLRLRDGRLHIPGIKDTIIVNWDRPLPEKYSSVTISRNSANQYFASFICEVQSVRKSGKGSIGLDMGLTDLIVDSNSIRYPNIKTFVNSQKQLRRLQQSLSRKPRGSVNYEKTRVRVAKLHLRIANQRKDHLHQITNEIISNNSLIGIETLRPSNMVKNRTLAKGILDASWSTLVEQLLYKADESGAVVVMADPFFPSSHNCNVTGELLDRKLKLTERNWVCVSCGETHDRDVNAANNLLKLAHYVNSNTSTRVTIPKKDERLVLFRDIAKTRVE